MVHLLRPARVCVMLWCAWCAAGLADAQTTPTPAVASSPQAPPRIEDPHVLTRHPLNHRDWTLLVQVRLNGSQPRYPGRVADPLPTQRINLDGATLFFPVLESSASHETWDDRIIGRWEMDGRLLSGAPRLLSGYQGGSRLGAWDAAAVSGNTMQLTLEIPMTTWETRIDEGRAAAVPWAVGDWPEEAASCLLPQLLIESDSAAVRLLLERWMRQAPGGPQPRGTPPYVLAKYLAGRVVSHYQPSSGAVETSGRGQNSRRYSGALVSGFAVDGAARAAERGRGPALDMANLLVAVYRAAGIPARLVVGYDNRVEDTRITETERKTLVARVRAWAEFYLYDEHRGRGVWVPVDVQRQREFSSRPPPLSQRWSFFGHHEDLDFMQPISFHWLPPTPCVNIGPPGLWGWVPRPEDALAEPDLRIVVRAASRRGDDPKRSTPGPGGDMRPRE